MEEEFEQIIQEAIEKAEQVECDFSEFVAGLELMVELLRDRALCAKEEQGG